MADDRRALVLRSGSELALAPSAAGPLAGMLSDALAVVEHFPARGEGSAKLSILIADEDGPTVKYLGELLSPSFAVTVAADGFDALDRLLMVQFDVIVLSEQLRGMDVSTLAMRLTETRPEILDRVILVSGPAGDSGMVHPERNGRPVLRKPVRLDQWDNAILAVLRKTKGAMYRSAESILVL